MTAMPDAVWFLEQECRALRTRLALVQPFVLHESMLPAAALAPDALLAVERFLIQGREELRRRLDAYYDWLLGAGASAPPDEQQRRFVSLRWRFNDVLTQFDTFQQAITQRSESRIGIWLSGLDVAARDALQLPGIAVPPIICYLDRGQGAAIRRARTRLAGGDPSPTALVLIPRERMIGSSGIASSLLHECGHQVAALLELVPSLHHEVRRYARRRPDDERPAWQLWQRWLSEIVADLHSVGKLGIGSTLGLMGVVSLPRVFVLRMTEGDPHPFPWIRVHLSCALGDVLYPHPQWAAVARLWDELYPATGLDAARQRLFATLRRTCPLLAGLLAGHRPPALRDHTLADIYPTRERTPDRLARQYDDVLTDPGRLCRERPTLAFAILGQARADGRLRPEDESTVVNDLLTRWALDSTFAAAGISLTSSKETP
ncbi:hypothetical protein AB0I34_17290 [Kribbella sp. NPDC050281]|uniref:hypothetical protein n=1 Tax=Kribbella sp. NPDC050281 TaxID=3155515 RepID=UPI0034047532